MFFNIAQKLIFASEFLKKMQKILVIDGARQNPAEKYKN